MITGLIATIWLYNHSSGIEGSQMSRILASKKENWLVYSVFSFFFLILIFLHFSSNTMLYLEIVFWFDLNIYLIKLLWDVLALNYIITILSFVKLHGDSQDNPQNNSQGVQSQNSTQYYDFGDDEKA